MILLKQMSRKARRAKQKSRSRETLPYSSQMLRIGQAKPSRGITWQMWHVAKELPMTIKRVKTLESGFRVNFHPMQSLCGTVKLFDTAPAPEEFFIRAAGDEGAVCWKCLNMITEKVEPEELSLKPSTRKNSKHVGKRNESGRKVGRKASGVPEPETDSPSESITV